MLCHHGFTPSVDDYCADVFFFCRHSRLVFEVVVPLVFFLLFVCVLRIPQVILGLLVSPLYPFSVFLLAITLNEKRV